MRKITAPEACRSASRLRTFGLLLAVSFGILATGATTPGYAQEPAPTPCDGDLDTQGITMGGGRQPDLKVEKTCTLRGGFYYFRNVNIVQGGKLIFIEPAAASQLKGQDFWASSIIIENGGQLLAGVDDQKPYGSNGKTLTLHLYGADPRGKDPTKSEGPGASCVKVTDTKAFADCGIPKAIWDANGVNSEGKPQKVTLPGKGPGGAPLTDYFYQYGHLHGDTGQSPETGQAGHFGYKVLALSYGGTLRLRGIKGTAGTSASDIATLLKDPDKQSGPEALNAVTDEPVITSSGTDWVRLAGLDKTKLTLSRSVDWQPGDEVVVTTTDYFPHHSELRVIAPVVSGDSSSDIRVATALEYDHNSTAYNVASKIGAATKDPKTETAFRTAVEQADGTDPAFLKTAETRAAVALLTRSIRIVSEGDFAGDTFDDATKGRAKVKPLDREVPANPNYMYGGHVVFRQGFEKLQIQGVEFKQLGQGGLLGRYPVHWHVARQVPADTYVIDSSVNESMTRWFVIHSTLGVTLARNVGYKSIGHGYFLEDATETDNKLYANIGIFARAAVVSAENPRNIPGLLEAPNRPENLPLKYHSDTQYPSVFWITNGWNSFAGNMAAGAGTCGACYWYVPAGNHDMMDVPPGNNMMTPMTWSGYSQIQGSPNGPGSNTRAGLTPVRLFYKNYCSTAMHSLTVTDGSPCAQVEGGSVRAVPNLRAPASPPVNPQGDAAEAMDSRMYYPRYSGLRKPTICDPAAADGTAKSCKIAACSFSNPDSCVPSVFSHYTSSFSWAQTNFSAIWLRSSYILLDHAFLSDVQGPGVTIVTGGDYSRSNLPVGYWGVTSNSIFVGATQPTNANASAKGPPCDNRGNVCLDQAVGKNLPSAGIGFPLANFGTGQRLYNVYDGPAYEDANAYLDIHPSPCNSRADCMYYGTLGVRKAATTFPGYGGTSIEKGTGYLPNAAIGWKQSNGFYYPPAFHSRKLFFKDVDIRHYVVEPLTFPGTYRTDVKAMEQQYVGSPNNGTFFLNWSDVDRQTELSDDDGSLTGFEATVSVNEDAFFAAPVQTSQCRSNVGVDASNACKGDTAANAPTARTSPYDHITTVIYPEKTGDPTWDINCTSEACFGVPIYRQYLTGKKLDAATSTREWAKWMTNKCDAQYTSLKGKTRLAYPYDRYDPAPPANRMLPILDATTMAFQKFEEECPSPFVRMAGMALFQRSVLTVNNGSYFIDTTRSDTYQRTTPELAPGSRFVNVFQPGRTYYVYFLFAKNTTVQTYQIYGGPGFSPSNVKGIRANVAVLPLPGNAVSQWDGAPWEITQAGDGIVQVKLDFSKVPVKDADLDPTSLTSVATDMDETCQPHTYCKKVTGGTKTTCGCDETKLGILQQLSPNYKNVCKNICEHWAVKDLDCPKGGCLGFQFTMSPNFKAQDQFVRPQPIEFPAPTWSALKFTRTPTNPDGDKSTVAGCYYADAKVPNDAGACKVAD